MSRDPHAAAAVHQGLNDDPSIPVLTERIFLTPEERDAALPAARLTEERPAPSVISNAAEPMPFEVEDAVETEGAREIEDRIAADAVVAEAALDAAAPELQLHDADWPSAATPDATAELPSAAATVAEMDRAGGVSAAVNDDPALSARAEALRSAVLQRVAERLPDQIHATVRDLMQPAIDQAIASIREEAQAALRGSLQVLVEQVLREELARHREDDGKR